VSWQQPAVAGFHRLSASPRGKYSVGSACACYRVFEISGHGSPKAESHFGFGAAKSPCLLVVTCLGAPPLSVPGCPMARRVGHAA
jgi:hypothetical protein